MLKKLSVLCFCIVSGWANSGEVHYDDAIVSASQFEDKLVQQESSQSLASFVANVRLGDSKDAVNALLGIPYSVEHLSKGSRWEYNVSIPTSPDSFMGCQFRIEFDAQNLVRSSDWRKSVCDLLYRQWVAPTVHKDEQQPEVFSILSDVLFGFNQYQLSKRGGQELDQFIVRLKKQYHTPAITITGHTDRIGPAEANQRISRLRAREVGRYFEKKGIPAKSVLIKGMGENAPIVVCADEQKDAALVECLSPNRRVEIEVYEMPFQS